ncbi:theronine dehydrogenase-like Zn-dependent dehydrogenase [Xenococcus sp. PCC 7305]|uniref:MDR/zinc-dependent alcohol dehydrogenase-like family protein n=1 Tax=Xenococcus sp. PCC 7305 TaxID=102125 RepID=UPI0002AD0317|nr:alcohol dehydrogenase catalytic domain-containing protein [Xenococcus sp. PCC 7305]ELS04181.1 theronine dehydrogenase-like Zn-dependent dehydrogenase [Xenococcus sp. PCC 7305]
MQGIWLEKQQLQLKTDLPIPDSRTGEVKVRVLRAGICNTDLELLRGYYPYKGILGHEFVGVVESGESNLVNKRVVGEINAACGKCHFCVTNQPTHCENRTVLGIMNRHGAFAEYLTLPATNLHPVPEQVTTDAATFTEPLAAALEITKQVNILPEHKVLVVGDGKLGQLVAQTIALTGCNLLVIGRHHEKLERLESRGIQVGFADLVAPRSFDVAIECTGNPDGFNLALSGLRPRGTLVLKSTYAGKLTLDASALVVDEITVVGSRCGPFAKALDLLSENKVDVTSLIETCYPLKEGLAAFDHAQRRGTLKVLLNMES